MGVAPCSTKYNSWNNSSSGIWVCWTYRTQSPPNPIERRLHVLTRTPGDSNDCKYQETLGSKAFPKNSLDHTRSGPALNLTFESQTMPVCLQYYSFSDLCEQTLC